MASLLRQIIAGPRAPHAESNLDLCYVTPFIIATSGPSGTYPQRAYRNPLDQLVRFLDANHGVDWCIWEFRAEGTGYPDSEVHGRVRHYPWPDHHPPPFAVVPLVMGGMRQWLAEGERIAEGKGEDGEEGRRRCGGRNPRVVVGHCKAGKGRTGSMAVSYLISECGWSAGDALARFTERRMRPGFGEGVSIPSQLRWVGYVERWTRGGKVYVEREVEVLEVHCWGLRDGVKVAVEGFVEEGKVIKTFHVFGRRERVVVEGNAPGSSGFTDYVSDMAGYGNKIEPKVPRDANATDVDGSNTAARIEKARRVASDPERLSSPEVSRPPKTTTMSSKLAHPTGTSNTITTPSTTTSSSGSEAGGTAVIFKPLKPIILPTSDINIDFERRNKATLGLSMVTAVAHVWFNAFFEGNGPETNGVAEREGVFEIEWDKMDGIKGSLRKGTRAFDRLAVVWRVVPTSAGMSGASGASSASGEEGEEGEGRDGRVVTEPGETSPVPEMRAADWRGESSLHHAASSSGGGSGGGGGGSGLGKDLGLRSETPASADVSKASSIRSGKGGTSGGGVEEQAKAQADADEDSVKGVKSSGPAGESELEMVDVKELPEPAGDAKEPSLRDVNEGLDTATKTTPLRGLEGDGDGDKDAGAS